MDNAESRYGRVAAASQAHGILTAILSNMGDTVLENIEREFPWIRNSMFWSGVISYE